MAIWPNAAQEKLNATRHLDLLLIGHAFSFEIGGVPIQYVDVRRVDVDVGEEMLIHKAMVALRVLSWNPYILVLAKLDGQTS